MDGYRLRSLCQRDLGSVYADCGLAGMVHGPLLTREKMIQDILSWLQKWQVDASVVVEQPVAHEKVMKRQRPPATPVRGRRAHVAARSVQTPCASCGWQPVGSICACVFMRIDPLRPVGTVRALASFSAVSSSEPFCGSVTVKVDVVC